MSPSASQTHEIVLRAMNIASRKEGFGRRLLVGGKTSALRGARREVWLSAEIAAAFHAAGFHAHPEYPLRDGGRIDVAFLDGHQVQCAIEVKFYYAHQCGRSSGHPYLCNSYWDFYKRATAGVKNQQAVVL